MIRNRENPQDEGAKSNRESVDSYFEFAAKTREHLGQLSTRTQIVALTCACAGATAFLYAVDPNRHAIYPQCLLYRLTGFYCAGCGATRAAYALLHGRIVEALHDNALFVAALPLVLTVAGLHFLGAWRKNAWPDVTPDPSAIAWRGGAFLALMLAFSLVRNLPGWPFDLLKPLTV